MLATDASADAASAVVTADPAVSTVLPFDLVHFDSASLQNDGSATQTSVGVLVGVEPGYTDATGLFAVSSGAREPGGTL